MITIAIAILHNEGDLLYIVTNRNAPNKKVVTASFQNPQVEYWQDFISETKHVLSPSFGGGYFFAHYMIDAISKVYQFDTEGQNLGEIQLPGVGSSGGFSHEKKKKNCIIVLQLSHAKLFINTMESRQ